VLEDGKGGECVEEGIGRGGVGWWGYRRSTSGNSVG